MDQNDLQNKRILHGGVILPAFPADSSVFGLPVDDGNIDRMYQVLVESCWDES